MRVAERALAPARPRAASPRQAPATSKRPRSVKREPLPSAQIARSPVTLAALRGLSLAMKLDLLLFGRVRSGPFFALLEKTESR